MESRGLTDPTVELEALKERLVQLENSLDELGLSLSDAQQRFRTLMDYAPAAVVIMDVETGRFIDVNPMAEKMFGMSRERLLQVGPIELSPASQPDGPSAERGREHIQKAVAGEESVFEWWHLAADGERFLAEIRLIRMPWGERDVLRGTIVDISERKQIELSELGRSRMLEQIARGASLPGVLSALITTIQQLLPGMICSVLTLEPDTKRLRVGAAPSLPDFYNEAVDGLRIGPDVGSCGAAAHRGQRVVVHDVMEHPNWADYRDLAERAGIRACWSEPVFSLDGEVLGTLALYYREPRSPVALELQLITIGARQAGIAIEHDATRRVLRAMNQTLEDRVREKTRELTDANRDLRAAEQDQRLAAVAFQTHDSILITDVAGTILRVNDSFTAMTGYTADDVVGKTPRVLKSGLHDEEFYREMWRAIRHEGHWSGEVWNRRKDGSVFPQHLTITAVRDGAGNITHYVGGGRDDSEQRQAAANREAIRVARDVQQSLFPLGPPVVPGLDIAGAVFAAEHVSGDYFDYLQLGPTKLGLVVADVSGHGLGPAMMMAQTQAFVRALADSREDPGDILTAANRLFVPRHDGRFVTLFLACLDTESRCLHYAGAGHQGHMIDASGRVTTLRSTGVPLRVIQGETIPTSASVSLKPGDILLLPTDGCEEAIGPGEQFFGRRRMFDVVRACRDQSSAQIIQAVHTAVRKFSQGLPQTDDITLVVVKT